MSNPLIDLKAAAARMKELTGFAPKSFVCSGTLLIEMHQSGVALGGLVCMVPSKDLKMVQEYFAKVDGEKPVLGYMDECKCHPTKSGEEPTDA